MAGSRGRTREFGQSVTPSDRWGLLILACGFAAGAAIGLGLPALIAYQLRADPVDIPGEWRTTASADDDAAPTGGGHLPAP